MRRRRTRSKTKTAKSGEHSLPNGELEVLACIWKHGEATSNQICEMMQSYRPLTVSSVRTLLDRLMARGLIRRRKGPVGKAFLYKATNQAQIGHRRVLGNLLHRVFAGDSMAMIVSVIREKPPTPEEAEELKQLLDQLCGEKNERGSGK